MKMKVIWYVKASDEKIKPHFKASEFQCKDKTEELLVSQDLLNILEEIRKHFDTPVIINSGYRTPSWNSKVGGTPNSYHCKGMAADIVVKGKSSKEVAEYANSIMEKGGIIRYTNFVHVDVREKRYRKGV
jgi:uncharacterized protein YcbK (DUF882 family)